MTHIDQYRESLRNIAAKAAGVSISDQIFYRGGLLASREGGPSSRMETQKPDFFQCLDPTSPNYGKRVFVVGIDPVGSSDFLVGETCE